LGKRDKGKEIRKREGEREKEEGEQEKLGERAGGKRKGKWG